MTESSSTGPADLPAPPSALGRIQDTTGQTQDSAASHRRRLTPHGAADGGHVPQLRGRQPGENAVDGQLREVEQRGVPRGLGALHLGHRALPLEGRHERHGVRGRARGRGRGRDPAEQPVAGQEAEQREREFLAEGGEEESHVTGAWLGEEEEAGEDEGGDEGKHRSIRDKKHSDDG